MASRLPAPRDAWRLFAANYHLFDATPSKTWIDHSLSFVFGIDTPLGPDTADAIYDRIDAALKTPDLLPLAVLDKANVEVLATTEFALDPLPHHQTLKDKGLIGRIRTTYRPDDVTDPDKPGFAERIAALGQLTGENTATWAGLINAHRTRRAYFREFGAVATDHGVPTGLTRRSRRDRQAEARSTSALRGRLDAAGAELFRAQMLTEMAGLSVEDGMVMQIHAGSKRNTDPMLFADARRRSGRRHSERRQLRPRSAAAACRTTATSPISGSSCSPSTRRSMPANWRRWPATGPR